MTLPPRFRVAVALAVVSLTVAATASRARAATPDVGVAGADGRACHADGECPAHEFCTDAGACTTRSYLPLYLRFNDRQDHATTTVVGPFAHVGDRRGTTDVLFPILWHFRDDATRASTTVLFPIFASHQAPTEGGAVVGPFFGWRDPHGYRGGLFPLLFFGEHDARSHQVLFPFFFRARDAAAGTETVAALTTWFHRAPDGWDGGSFPVALAGRHGDFHYGSVLGLYNWGGDRHGSSHVLGPLYASSSDRGYAFGLAPFLHFGASGTTRLRWFLPPLYFHSSDESARRRFTLVGPIFSNHDGSDSTSGVFPLYWSVERGLRRFDGLLPLFGHYRDAARGTDDLWVGNYFRLRDERRSATSHVFFPLLFQHDEPDYHVTVQFPFYWHVEGKGETTTALFPLYLRVRQKDLAADVAFPLYWDFVAPRSRTTVVGSAFYRTSTEPSHERTDAAFFPLGGYGRAPGRSYQWALPLAFFHEADDRAGTARTILGPFVWDRTPTTFSAALVPLYFGWKRGPITRHLAPAFYRSSNEVTHERLTVLGPLYAGGGDHHSRFGVLPLLFTSGHDDGTWNATLFPLFHAGKKADGGSRLLTPIGGYSTYPGGGKGFLGPVYARSDKDGYTASLIPLFLRDVDTKVGSATTLVPPLFLHRTTKESSLTAVTPLLWHFRDVESSTTLAFPLFFDRSVPFESRTLAVMPLFIHHTSLSDHTSSTVVPPLLLYHHAGAEGHDVVLFPLLWRFAGRTADDQPARTTVLFPLLWDLSRGSSRTTVLFPLFVRAVRETAVHTLVLNFYYRHGINAQAGSYSWNLFPLIDYGHPHVGDVEWSVLEGFVGYSRIGKLRTLHLFWATEVALEPAQGPPATTFFGPSSSKSERLSLE